MTEPTQPTLELELDKSSPTPIYAQLADQLRLLVHRGQLTPNQPLPTVRSLAVDLGINANTVTRVYRDLQREGLLRLERGIGTFVTENVRGSTVPEGAFQRLEALGKELVDLARRCGLRVGEVNQLIESLWKESPDASR